MGRKRQRNKRQKQGALQSSIGYLLTDEAYDTLCVSGYTRLDRCPEIIAGCRKIADLISSMTIYLMANTEHGDVRIQNEMSRKLDINPFQYMTRKTWMDSIVMTLLLYGNGNSVVIPHTRDGYLEDMEPIAARRVSFVPDGVGYYATIDGIRYDSNDILHFVLNPDEDYPWRGAGLSAPLREVADNLRQAAATEKGFMASKYKPSLIVKVDGIVDEFSSAKGREILARKYLETTRQGEPWIIPAGVIDVEQIKPLSLNDLAISETVALDKQTVAAILGVPPFVLGVGEYSADEWNAFINNTIRPIVRGIEQEMTRKLLLSPRWYIRFNVASLYSYDLEAVAAVYSGLYTKGLVTGNEARDKLGLEPIDGLDELTILENYIPLDKIGEQLKLSQ